MRPSKIKSKVWKLDEGKPSLQSNEEKDLQAIQRDAVGGLNGGKARAKKTSAKKK